MSIDAAEPRDAPTVDLRNEPTLAADHEPDFANARMPAYLARLGNPAVGIAVTSANWAQLFVVLWMLAISEPLWVVSLPTAASDARLAVTVAMMLLGTVALGLLRRRIALARAHDTPAATDHLLPYVCPILCMLPLLVSAEEMMAHRVDATRLIVGMLLPSLALAVAWPWRSARLTALAELLVGSVSPVLVIVLPLFVYVNRGNFAYLTSVGIPPGLIIYGIIVVCIACASYAWVLRGSRLESRWREEGLKLGQLDSVDLLIRFPDSTLLELPFDELKMVPEFNQQPARWLMQFVATQRRDRGLPLLAEDLPPPTTSPPPAEHAGSTGGGTETD